MKRNLEFAFHVFLVIVALAMAGTTFWAAIQREIHSAADGLPIGVPRQLPCPKCSTGTIYFGEAGYRGLWHCDKCRRVFQATVEGKVLQ